ncbi:hypothetical protein BC826DRAFT_989112 [Russula brevipes]|nr:hypothetical protein BC826DRAFT_989112 [Russula brevipes]
MEQVKNKIPHFQLSLYLIMPSRIPWMACIFGELANSQLSRYDWSGKFSHSYSRVLGAVANASSTWRKPCRDADWRVNTLGSSQCGPTAHHQKTPWDYAAYQAHESQHEFVKQVNRDLKTSDPVGLSERYYTETSNGKAGDGLGDRIDPFRSNLTETTEPSGGSLRRADADDPAPPHSANGQGIMGPFTAAKQHCEFRGVVGSTWAMADADGRDPYWTFLRVDAFGENGTKCHYHERSAKAFRGAVQRLRRKRY